MIRRPKKPALKAPASTRPLKHKKTPYRRSLTRKELHARTVQHSDWLQIKLSTPSSFLPNIDAAKKELEELNAKIEAFNPVWTLTEVEAEELGFPKR